MTQDPDIAALMPPASGAAPAKRPWWRRLLPVLGGFVGGGVVGAGVAAIGLPLLETLPPSTGFAVLAGFFLSLWPHIVVHEAGHALAGLSRGMHAIAFGVGPLRWERGGDDHWRWRNGGGIRGVGGFAALVPRGTRGLSRFDQMIFLCGGPLANLLTAAVLAALVAWLPMPAWLTGTLIGVALGAATLGLGNLIPLHVQGWRTDGRGLLDLLRRTPDAALQLQVNQLMALSLAGVRPRDWPEAALPAGDAVIASSSLQQTAQILRLSRAIDRRDAGAARPEALALTAAFASAPPVFQSAIAVALASHAALLIGDRRLLSAWRLRCEGGLMDLSPYRAWLDAEIARLDGDGAAASMHVERARGLISRIPDAASRLVFEERLAALA
ncbi:site-2 protease family protein [Luteimonas sp. 3794]|uniref:site-2 protease family protein n=1 Tax=Luteimonas sp. 3794 TaxID=2817730 RepID=UPI00286BAA67|nr:site-2 protease family protein [Luteimonas sp. 3794]